MISIGGSWQELGVWNAEFVAGPLPRLISHDLQPLTLLPETGDVIFRRRIVQLRLDNWPQSSVRGVAVGLH
jgi:hypothetical protein